MPVDPDAECLGHIKPDAARPKAKQMVTLRLPLELHARLAAASNGQRKSMNLLAIALIDAGLTNLEKDQTDAG